jgi:hypothetical protein
MIGLPAVRRFLLSVGLALGLGAPGMAVASDLASAQLLIAGSRLAVSPESQTVPYDTPTIVETHLVGYDPERGVLPADLRVQADFTGPEIDGILVLETVPNQPFRIPRLRLQGEYRLDNIRLMQGDDLLGYAQPRSAAVLVTQVLVTKVTSRALTEDEIRSYGIVVNDDSFQAFNFTFGFAVAGETVNYNVPVLWYGPGKEQVILADFMSFEGPARSSSARFTPPSMVPFQLSFESPERDNSNGGCQDVEGDCSRDSVLPLPGVIMFPTDVSLLHQFFSVVLLAQNAAPAGDRLEIHDLTAKITLPPGLRQADTEPPTPLGVPVPVRVPGPDGELGTGDDLTFLVAQATGQAEVLVEGLREGTHIVRFDLEGVLEGMPDGEPRRISGTAQGAVIVRDPTLNITITHPDVVRTDEEYTMLLTVTNTGNAPANQLSIKLPLDALSGVEVVGENEKTVTIQPGDAELVEFRLRSLLTGRVVASAVRSSSQIVPGFELTVGVGENGIPLSPNAIILPRATGTLPPDLLRNSLNLVGLGFSLATAPPSLLRPDLPRVSRPAVDTRVYELAQAGRHVALGETLFDSAAQLAAEWTGARDADWEWDLLRRTTQKGAKVGGSLGAIFAAEAAATTPQATFDRFAKTTGYLPVMQGALATGAGVTLEVASRTGGQRLAGGGFEAVRVRQLPFADLYRLGDAAQMALLAVPEDGGYRATVRAASTVSAGLHLLVPKADGTLRMVRWTGVSLAEDGEATAEFRAADNAFVLFVDADGDGETDQEIAGAVSTLARRPFSAIGAVQNSESDPTGHVVDVLFTTDVDLRSLAPRDPAHFAIPGKVSNGGWIAGEQDVIDGSGNTVENPFEGMRNSRIVRVVFNNPLSPYTPQNLTVRGVENPLGEEVVSTTLQVVTTAQHPGTLVQGTVFGPDGKPVPFADVELRESDMCLFCEESCRSHKTAVVRADASGNYLFDYVRQTGCSDVYSLKGIDAATGRSGTATGRVRFIGQTVRLDVMMLGRGTIRGKVRYDNGAVPPRARVIAHSPVFREGRGALIDENGNYSVSEIPVGTITLSATDGDGRFVVKTVVVPEAGSVVEHDLVILRQPEAPVATGEVRGTVFRPNGTTPVVDAYVALYVDGNLAGVLRSGSDGTFDFGKVPSGRGEIETFEGLTGQSGVQVFFDVKPDQVNNVPLIMRDERGVVEGYVFRKTGAGDIPLQGVIVWAEGTPFKTVTDAQGFYRLEGVFAGTRNISAADLVKKVKTSEVVTIGVEGQLVNRNLYFQEIVVGGIAGEVLDFNGNPVYGATVHLAAGDQHWYRTAKTDTNGRFTIPDLGVGGYEVHAFKGAVGGKAGALVRFAGDTPFVTIRFKKGTIRGVVRAQNDSGQWLGVSAVVTYRTTAVRLELVGMDLESHNLVTEDDGTFEIPDVLVGPYVLTVTNSFYGTKTIRGELVVHGEAHDHAFEFERNLTGTIRGTVFDHDGVTPVQGAKVDLRHPNFAVYQKTSNAEGRFSFELVPPTPWAFTVDVVYENGMIFRKAQAWIRFSQRGQELDVDIVLPKQGSISGQVVDSNADPVPGAVVNLQEGSYPRRSLVVNADAEGGFQFNNIFAGTVTLSARAPALGGLGGKTTAEIKADGEAVSGVVITLEATGKVAGVVKTATGDAAVPSAEVRLLRYGYLFDTINADSEGRFEFNLLPLAWYEVYAFDPRTGRHGKRTGLYVGENNQVVVGDVTLEARGDVDGHLYEPGTTLGIPGATVALHAQSIASFTTYSSTNADGYFEFLGIPQGKFDLTTREPGGRRRAWGKGEIVSEGQRVTVDLFLERQGTVIGSVLNPLGAPNGIFPNANTILYQDGQIIGATLDSEYEFDGVILGHDYWLIAQEIGGPHRGQVYSRITEEGPVEVNVRMRPIGSAVVNVRDSFGNPIPFAEVELVNDGFYGYKRFAGDTGSDHSITFQELGEGRISAYAKNPANGLRGSASAALTQDGEIVQIDIALQNSGQVKGVVVLADGVTPAAGALAALQIAGRTLTAVTEETGAFLFPSVPMGNFLLVLQESFGPGMREIRHGLSTNGQVLDLGTVVLDEKAPRVVEITPAAGAVDLPLSTVAVVRFSEAIDPSRHLASSVASLETSTGSGVGASYAWIDGNTALRITPSQPLQNFTTYRVRVRAAYTFDPAGRRLDQDVQTSFTTADVVGPSVIEANPANNARQVPLGAQLRVMFSEVVDEFSLSGTAIQLTDLTTGAGAGTTFLMDSAGRTAIITPVGGLVEEHTYRLTVQGVADKVGNTMPQPFVTGFYAWDGTGPRFGAIEPAAGASFTAGDLVPLSAVATDPSGVRDVTFKLGGRSALDASSPYTASLRIPRVAQEGDAEVRLEAVDTQGNLAVTTRMIHVLPRANASAPVIEAACPRDGDEVAPGVPVDITVTASDDEGLESFTLLVNGQAVAAANASGEARSSAAFSWTPPAGSPAGTSFALRLEVRDFAGNVAVREATVTVPAGVILTGNQTLTVARNGQNLVLGRGVYTVSDPIQPASLKLLQGARLVSAAGKQVQLTVAGEVEVQCGATIDASALGYSGGNVNHPVGFAPDGVTGSSQDSGGSHGGRGLQSGAGEVYDSVYAPRLGGGGGAHRGNAGAGGGGVRIEAATVDLSGEILAKGQPWCNGGSGAGGTVAIIAGVLSGEGRIDASGGDQMTAPDCNDYNVGAGGGGRVSILAGTLDGFDPSTQARAWGGGDWHRTAFAAPGTVFSKTSGDTYGSLLVDAGEIDGADRVSLPTELPVLGTGAVTAFAGAGADAWVSAAAAFPAKWLGVWVRLQDGSGADLGTFRVAEIAEIDGTGRLRLAGAGAVSGTATYRGEYRFDQIDVKNGAGLDAVDPVLATASTFQGEAELAAPLSGTSARLLAGAVVRPARGQELRLSLTGKLTIEAGARLDVSNFGYAGGNVNHPVGYVPAGVTGSSADSGGSHGGRGLQTGAGEVYDSVYAPRQGGGGGAHRGNAGVGGGVVRIEAGEVELAGEIRAQGQTWCNGGSGAGGTVAIVAGVMSGAGLIDASGGDQMTTPDCNDYNVGAGGGGRVSIVTGTWNGFDPAAQIKAWGGGDWHRAAFAAPGTVFAKDGGDTYGVLLVDAGELNGTDRPSRVTELPALGTGSVTAVEAVGSDLWVSAAASFPAKWLGVWVQLRDASGADLGSFPVAEIDGAGRLRLTGAGAVLGAVTGGSYQGEYRFDQVAFKNGAGVQATDPIIGPELVLEGNAQVTGEIQAASVLVKAGAVVRPAAGGELRIVTPGKLTIEAGARLDVTGLGYAGGHVNHPTGFAPAGVAGAAGYGGGSHGGRGLYNSNGSGELYDSVYEPRQGGGGGGHRGGAGAGGGVVRIEAGEVDLAGEIRARGEVWCNGGSGAGGTVAIVTGVMSGAGLIDASGADQMTNPDCNDYDVGAGGGGRVSIVTGTWAGFDPASQVRAWGGGDWHRTAFAAPGTVFYKQDGDTYGSLLVDAGEISGADRVSLSTELPVLGNGAVTAVEAVGGDLWVTAAAGFPAKWAGVWVRLHSAAGADLGTFRGAEIDGTGRLRLAGAGTVTGPAIYAGEYRFDRVDVENGAGLDTSDPVRSTDSTFEGQAELAGELSGGSARLLSGAVVRPARGSELRLTLSGTLTVESNARLDVTASGYAGGNSGHPAGYAPAGVTGSSGSAGGSHGGRGLYNSGNAGETYDSVYAPRQGGGGGGHRGNAGMGGGVVRIEAGAVALAGEIRARGEVWCNGGSGAGGTVAIVTGAISGAGLIDASGADQMTTPDCNDYDVGAGGGGRVSVVTGTWSGFDPVTQIRAWGGGDWHRASFAAPGTIYLKDGDDPYGVLQVDAGELNGVDRASLITQLPVLGTGSVTGFTASGADAWLSAAAPFAAKWRGVWVKLLSATGTDLGTFQVAEIEEVGGVGRLRLTGAGTVTSAVTGGSYRGEYRFDRIEFKNGAGLQATDPIVGPELVLEGNAQVSGEIQAANVRVKAGAVVKPAAGGELRIVTPGKLTIEAGARLDVTGLGYAGGNVNHNVGYVPAGVTGSSVDSGGSHGGRGLQTGAGELYDSVYEPRLGGGGGAHRGNAGAGGGVVRIEAGEVELAGEIRARGQAWCNGGAGAGGTVAIVTGVMSGTGLIDASGGDQDNNSSTPACGDYNVGAGGGGRVSILAGTLDGFDPSAQVRAWGGGDWHRTAFAAPGTVFSKKDGDTYGSLLVDAGEINGADRVSLVTELPVLGTGAVTAFAEAGADAWVSAAAAFPAKWLGVWVRLQDGSGADLGAFRVAEIAEIDGTGRLRLTGAGAVSGAATYQGEYRFDRVDVKNGAGLDAADPLLATASAFEGEVELTAALSGTSARLLPNAVLRPARGQELRFSLTGKLTVEAGARLDVTAFGYRGGHSGHDAGYAPDGVTGSASYAGGSHGGRGLRTGAGEVYDSVYAPRQAGGGGGRRNESAWGGGVVRIEAGEVELAGEIRARGQSWCDGGAGGGGTVAIVTGVMSGAGLIDASGGDQNNGGSTPACNNYDVGAGGGGRVSIVTGTWSGFDPATQVRAWGGGNWSRNSFAAPGTVYLKDGTATYGLLRVDAGEIGGADRVSLVTELPALGSGAVTAVQTAGGDLWVSAASPFLAKWLGVRVQLRNASGADLGTFPVAEIDGAGRLRLTGAGAVAGASTYRGEYRFDRVELSNGAGLDAVDAVVSTETTFEGESELTAPLSGTSARLLSGAVLRPARGHELGVALSGKLTIEAGARLDVTGFGYKGGHSGHDAGYAPDGVTGSASYAGGSHGGRGLGTGAGEVYDSLFAPRQAGGGGGRRNESAIGGGVVRIEAGEVDLAGEIRARGQSWCDGGSGGGGTVAIVTGVMSGAGLIDASGGDQMTSPDCNDYDVGAGGGGRVSITTGTWNGFVPATQVRAWGGGDWHRTAFAAPGTVYIRSAGQTEGELLIDQGRTSGTVTATNLPSIGKGIVGAVTVDAAVPSALWIEPQSPSVLFGSGVAGMKVRINGVEYDVIGQSADRRRLLLAGAAGAVSVGQPYLGVYRFDALTVAGRALLTMGDDLAVASAPTVASGSTLTVFDLTPPVITVTQPAAGAVYTPGQSVAITAQVTDDRGVASVTFRLGDQSFTDTASPYTWTSYAPIVEAEADVAITVEALDTNANLATVNHLIHVQPLVAGAPPAVSFTCPTAGAILAPGTGLDLAAAASHANGIEKVEFLVDGAVMATDYQAPYTYRMTAPAGAVDGQALSVKARARAFSGTVAEAEVAVEIVQGSVVSADRTVAANDLSLDGTSVVVAAGTLTLTGPHTFRDLVVLDGAKVTHPETTASQEFKLDLTVQRDVYVACGGSIDATGRGFLGGPSGQRGYGYGNTQTEGANQYVGGSHGGRGGRFDGSGAVYGSFYDPRDSGAGGGYNGGSKGADGGGVVRVTATGEAVIDGSVLANGQTGVSGAGGAGGSIRINAAAVRGAGTIQASGSVGSAGAAGGGGGGRVALYAASFDAGLLGRTLALGAKPSGLADAKDWGAAGTVFIKPDAQALGDLILDNGGTASAQYTELIPVGRGLVDSVSADGFTDLEADFRHSLGAAEVAFNGDLGTLYTVSSHTHHGTSLTLIVPAPPLSGLVEPGDSYEGVYRFHRVVVRGGARGLALDRVISTNTPEVAAGASWSESYAPSVQLTSPAAGAVFTSGSTVTVGADTVDVLGIKNVELRFGAQSFLDTAAPYTWSFSAPEVTEPTDFQVSAAAIDLSGNRFAAVRTIQVVPVVDPQAPVVTLGTCPASGDAILPGVAVNLSLTAADNAAVQRYSLVVDGTPVQTVNVAAGQAQVTGTLTWTPPANTAAGTVFDVRVEARDFAGGVGFASLSLAVPSTPVLTGTQSLTSALNGQAVFLGAGAFTAQGPLDLASLTLLNGARLMAPAGQALDVGAAGNIRVQCGAAIDVSGRGYLGATAANTPGAAPAGVIPSSVDAGGSHGGLGTLFSGAGPAGEAYDSVYEPRLGGGGGSLRAWTNGRHGGNGGGVVLLDAAVVSLSGEILARGEATTGYGQTEAGGAGGSVAIRAGTLSGAGTIDASGGMYWAGSTSDSYKAGSGGGGRVALHVDALSGFDPAAQVKAQGGVLKDYYGTILRYGGPGTVFVKQPSQTYGRLIVDSGEDAGTDRVGAPTPLPALGSGDVTLFEVSGSDAWVTAAAAWKSHWDGAWMSLETAEGASLGSFRVLARDGDRALLAGAGNVEGAVQYRGRYLFDQVDLRNGAGLASQDEVRLGDAVAEGAARLPQRFTADNLTVKAGAVVTPAQGGELRGTVTGTLTVEANGRIDVSNLGYLGGTAANSPGTAPAGVAASAVDAGGSHGGLGTLFSGAGPVGEVYGSVYQPQLAGAGGSLRAHAAGRHGGNGGGIVVLDVGTLALHGEIRAQGEATPGGGQTQAGGAGGSVLVSADTISGAGKIDVSGGMYWAGSTSDSYKAGGGGGGRVALYADTLSGFDPAAQVKALGGVVLDYYGTLIRYSGPGTVFVKLPSQTHGRLIVDNGKEGNGSERIGPPTPLPALGAGGVTAFQVSGADAWVTAAAAFKAPWAGAWMTLENAAGTVLGSFRVVALDGARVLLEGAGTVVGAAHYRGEYRFDQVDLYNGAGLAGPSEDTELRLGLAVVRGAARLPKRFAADNLTLKSGAVATVAGGGELRATVSGTMTIESNARLDVSGLGYLGGVAANSPGGAPAGVAASAVDAGGSHGGLGTLFSGAGPAGEVFGSVYEPLFGGGGGSLRVTAAGRHGGNGGGVAVLDVGSLVLQGEIRSRGEGIAGGGNTEAGGAGGSVLVLADTMSGAGLIDVSGGQYWAGSTSDSYKAGSGGGGRVALYVDSFSGFDPAAQVKAWGGVLQDYYGTIQRYAGPGTVFVKQPSQTYGRLIVDSGEVGTTDRVGSATPLPVLGTGDLTLLEPEGADAWVTAASAWKAPWAGAWMALKTSAGASLGAFRVLELDGNRALLQGAGSVVGAARYGGQYRFDRVDLRNGAGLSGSDELLLGDVTAEGAARLPALFSAHDVTLKTGAVATVALGGELRAMASGTLTIESGARLDVSLLGYQGGTAASSPGTAPANVTASAIDAGGSHGGVGSLFTGAGPAGEVYGSVYDPLFGGGSGTLRSSSPPRHGGHGGGVVVLDVDALVLDGEIRARGESIPGGGVSQGGGAGGSVRIDASVLSGAGLIDAGGGEYWAGSTGDSHKAGSGGGGRVALFVDSFSGFDPVTQVRARGGLLRDYYGTNLRWAGPGTLYVKQPGQTHGKLYVDQGGASGLSLPNTPLPSAGTGTIGVAEADTVDTDALWIEPLDPAAKFALGAVGMWVRVDGTDYRVLAQTADRRRVLLDLAAGIVDEGDSYRGVYKFDEVIVRGGAKLEFRDTNDVGTFTVDSTSSVIQNVPTP